MQSERKHPNGASTKMQTTSQAQTLFRIVTPASFGRAVVEGVGADLKFFLRFTLHRRGGGYGRPQAQDGQWERSSETMCGAAQWQWHTGPMHCP